MSSGSRYINIIYCKTYFNLCYVGRVYDWWRCQYRPTGGAVSTDRLVALSVPTDWWRCQYRPTGGAVSTDRLVALSVPTDRGWLQLSVSVIKINQLFNKHSKVVLIHICQYLKQYFKRMENILTAKL